jgi:type III pantothenate kinase
LPRSGRSTADELGAALLNLLELRGIGLADLTGSIISSTVPSLEPEWLEMGRRYLTHHMFAVGPGIRTGHADPHRQPARARADRLVNAGGRVRPRARSPSSPSTSARRQLRRRLGRRRSTSAASSRRGGGLPRRAHDAAARSCRRSTLAPPRSAIGKSTVDAIRSGVIYGYAAQVDGIVVRLQERLGEEAATHLI